MGDTLLALLSDWRVILVLVALVLLLPFIFYLASLDKSPVKVKRVKITRSKEKQDDTENPGEKTDTNDKENRGDLKE